MRLITLLLSLATALGVVVLPSAVNPGSVATEGRALSAEASPTVVFAPANNGILSPADTQLTLSATITNPTATAIQAGTASIYLDRSVVGSRSTLSSWLVAGQTLPTSKLGTAIASLPTPAIPAGLSLTFPLVIPAGAVGLAADATWGPRTLAVEVTSGGATIGQSRSTIVWNSAAAKVPVALAAAVPITVPASSSGIIPAATLTAYTGTNGLLTRQLAQAINRRVAIGIDPMIIASIRLLGPNGPPDAIAWLTRLQQAGNEIFPLSYADSDLAAASQAGSKRLLVPTSFAIDPKLFPGYTTAPTTSPTAAPTPNPAVTPVPAIPTAATLTDWVYTPALAQVAWPSDDTVVDTDLDAFAAGDLTTTILSSGNVSFGDLNSAPSAAALVEKHTAIISDAELSTLLRAASSATDDVTWGKAVADLSAAIAVVSRQRADARSLLATLGRSNPGDDARLGQTLEALQALPWAGIAHLSDFTGPAAIPVIATIVNQPESPERIATIRTMLASEASVGNFTSILDDPTVLTGERRETMLAILANSWNSQLPAWKTVAGRYLAQSTTTLGSVKIAKPGSLFVPARAVSLVVSVTNDLAYPVTVYVTVTSPSGVIRVEQPRVELRVEANSQAKASIPVRSLANGQVTVTTSLTSATNVPIGVTRAVDVDVQAGWETALTAVVTALIVAIFGFGIYRNIAKRRKTTRTSAEEAPVSDADV